MPASSHCGPPAHKNLYRAGAVFLLLPVAFRAASPLGAAEALALGGCLWWVAQRQTSPEAALLAAGFYAALPPAHPAAPLGLFAMLYTATGVAHALQGPRRKWVPRLGLMTALVCFTAAVDWRACAVGVLLACPFSLWLAERRRGVLLLCLAFWAAIAAPVARVFGASYGPHDVDSLLGPWRLHPSFLDLERIGSLALALVLAAMFYAVHPRSRFYGNTAPLALTVVLGILSLSWAAPFALLFLAGVAADMLSSPRSAAWRTCMWLLVVLGCGAAFFHFGNHCQPHLSAIKYAPPGRGDIPGRF